MNGRLSMQPPVLYPAARRRRRAAYPANEPLKPAAPDQAARLRELVESAAPRDPAPPPAVASDSIDRSQPLEIRCPVVAITSGKGGVGKTSLSVNLAIALARMGLRVTLLDADLGLANADVLCGVSPTTRLDAAVDLRRDGSRRSLDQLAIDAPGGFRLVPGAVGLARMANLSADQRAAIVSGLSALEQSSDVVIIDTGAGLSEGVTSFVAAADHTIVVATPEPTSIADAYALIKCVARDNPGLLGPRFSMVVNVAGNSDEGEDVHRRISATCRRFLAFQPALLGTVRRDNAVPASIRSRRPLFLSSPSALFCRDVQGVAESLARRLRLRTPEARQARPKGLLARLLGR